MSPDGESCGTVALMRNIWKGLFVGAVAGALVGFAVDTLYGAGDQLASATREARRRAPDAVVTGRSAVRSAVKSVRDATR
jgi:hypothetical protein